MTIRERVACSICGSDPGEPCDFDGKTPPPVVEDGVERRGVHAARYARTLPKEERPRFWEKAVEQYLGKSLDEVDKTQIGKRGASRGEQV